MANPCEQYCLDVVAALQADYPDFDWQARPDLGPTRMQSKDLSLTVSVAEWDTWHDGAEVETSATFSILVLYHAASAEDDGEGWWNVQGFVAGVSSWLTWRRIGQSRALSRVKPQVRPFYERDGAQSGWLIQWVDEIDLPARFEYHFADAAKAVGPEVPDEFFGPVNDQAVDLEAWYVS